MAINKFTCPPQSSAANQFSNNLVGVQLVAGGGLTQANFNFTTGISEKQNRTFTIGAFSEPINLESINIDTIAESREIIAKNYRIYPNYDLSEITSFSLYGSLAKRLSASVIKIINNFPAAIEVIALQQSGLFVGDTAFNITYDTVDDETTFDMDVRLFRNPFEIDYSVNAKRNIEVKPFPIHPIRALSSEFENYSLYLEDLIIEYPLTDFTPTQSLSGGTVTMTVQGNPFSGVSATTKSLIIKPNNRKTQEIFNDSFDEVEKFLLNQNTSPKYTAKFSYPDYNDDGKYIIYNRKLTWTLNKFWN